MTAVEEVTRGEDLLAKYQNATNGSNTENSESETDKVKSKKEKSLEQVPRGKPKSGRIWKEQKKKFSSIVKTRGLRLSFEKKKKLQDSLKQVKEISRARKAEMEAQKEAKKARRRANLKRAEENQRKSEVVQVITNTAKLKKIKRKNLRTIQKRDTLNM